VLERTDPDKQTLERTETTVQDLVEEMRQLREQVARLTVASPSDHAFIPSPASTGTITAVGPQTPPGTG
jgi:alpha-amylase/alpha-mannosidase (GH57 family)